MINGEWCCFLFILLIEYIRCNFVSGIIRHDFKRTSFSLSSRFTCWPELYVFIKLLISVHMVLYFCDFHVLDIDGCLTYCFFVVYGFAYEWISAMFVLKRGNFSVLIWNFLPSVGGIFRKGMDLFVKTFLYFWKWLPFVVDDKILGARPKVNTAAENCDRSQKPCLKTWLTVLSYSSAALW